MGMIDSAIEVNNETDGTTVSTSSTWFLKCVMEWMRAASGRPVSKHSLTWKAPGFRGGKTGEREWAPVALLDIRGDIATCSLKMLTGTRV